MLEELDQVPWDQLEHAYGPAIDVPNAIRALTSPVPETRNAAYSLLWSSIIHQGTVYSSTAYAVPFLIELLLAPDVADKPVVLRLLTNLACGNSYLDVHQYLFAEMGIYTEEMQQPDWQLQIETELGWVQRARKAVMAGWQTYLVLLDHSDPEIRWSTGYVLSVCQTYREDILPQIERHLTTEEDERVQASLLLCMGFLCTPEHTALLQDWVADSTVAPLARVTAAISWLRVAPGDVSRQTITVLLEALAAPQLLDERYLPLPWSEDESIVAVITAALGHLSADFNPQILSPILSALEGLQPRNIGSISMVSLILLRCIEPRKEPWKSTELTDLQRSVLSRLLRCERTWDWGNTMLLLRRYGLPDKQELVEHFFQDT